MSGLAPYKRAGYRILVIIVLIAGGCCCGCQKARCQQSQLPVLLKELASTQDSGKYVLMLGKVGTFYMTTNIDSSFFYAVKEYEMASRLQDKRGLADAYDLMSCCYILRTDFNIGGFYCYKALQLHKSLADSARIVLTLNDIYISYLNQGRPEEANNYFYEAFHMASRLPPENDSVYSILLINYAIRFHADTTRKDSVQWALRQAGVISRKYPYNRVSLYVDTYQADTLVKQGRGNEAEARINELGDEALQRGMPFVAMEIYSHVEEYRQMGYEADSTYYRELTFGLARKAGCPELVLPALVGLVDYYHQQGNREKENYYSGEIMKMAVKPRFQQKRDNVNYINFFLKQQSLHKLATRIQQQQKELERARSEKIYKLQIAAGLIVIVILLLILLFVRHRQYRVSQAHEKMMAAGYAAISLRNVTLKANDEFKNKLIAVIANEFRAPLHYISDAALQLGSKDIDQPSMAALIRKIAIVSGNTLSVFDNILKWIALQLSGFKYQPVSCKLNDILREVTKALTPVAAEKMLTIVNQAPENIVVCSDREMLKMVVLHLVRLSIGFTQPATLLVITSWVTGERTFIRITADTGDNLTTILKSLSRWQDDMHALTLAIVRDFVEKMNGTTTVTESAGKYLVFTIDFPGMPTSVA
ncbi:HAMP domain-containing sensor histidine kinase [Chitinophaga sp. 212800010-3]|uniref:sensor histidine kinase n=1 Tax=unclassified Chitinophaga TaxID=2619133 RepID=UPI002DED3FA4|nr:Histidine kinase domain-containing protein [Chitinophaga sp. 212800010-3]